MTPALPIMDSASAPLLNVVHRARRRSLVHLGFQDVLEACTAALLGPACLLVLGTDLLHETLLLVFLAAGLVFGTYRWLRARPCAYGVAQKLDSRWGTDDQISTAYYFTEYPENRGPLAKQQQDLAVPLATSGDIAAALPLQMPKAAYACAGMVVLIAGLFALRYSVQSSLSLKPPLPPIVMQALLGERAEELWEQEPSEELAEASQQTAASNREERELDPDTRGDQPEPVPQIAGGGQPPEALAEDLMEVPEVEGLSFDEQYGDELAAAEGEGQESGDEQAGLEADADERRPGDASPLRDPSRPDAGSMSEESNDLLSRLQDAFEKMLSSMNLQEKRTGESGDPTGGEESQQPGETGAEAQAQAGEGQEGGESDSQGQDGGGTPENPQELAQGEGGSEASNLTPEDQATSSAGSNDGSKELAEAALSQAMGALSELYSRRAEEMSGEVLIETEAGPQELQTPYSPSEAGHRDPGGVIRRDRIPHAYRHFIQKYFEALQEKN